MRQTHGLDALDMTYDQYVETLAGIADVQRWERGEDPFAGKVGIGEKKKPMSVEEWVAFAKENRAEAARLATGGPAKLDPSAKKKLYDDLFTQGGTRLLGVRVNTAGA